MTRRRPRIVAIGGGEIRKLETLPIDRRIVELTRRHRPAALFIPTASGDPEAYVETFADVYGRRLGCRTSVLTLTRDRPCRSRIAEMIRRAHLIYVGGGNTYRMMRLWRKLGVDRRLRAAAGRGTVLAGVSAGGICWFRHGHSDSRRFSGKENWQPIRVTGLGLIDAMFCPHYRAQERERSLDEMVRKRGGTAIACDDSAAVEIVGREYRILRAKRGARAWRVFRHNGRAVREELRSGRTGRPLDDLLASEARGASRRRCPPSRPGDRKRIRKRP